MARPIWSGSITFGLVIVPVKLYSAVREKEVRFHELHDEDGARLQHKRVCSADGKEVPYEHVARGFEVAKDQYVVLSDEELAALDPKGGRSIDIDRFVDRSEIDPLFYDRAYYSMPDRGADKPYALLVKTMEEEKKVAIGRMIMRTKQYLVAIRPQKGVLTIETMHYADEIVDPGSLEDRPRAAHPSAQELAMARQLVGTLVAPFDAKDFKDEHRERVQELIRRKSEGEEIKAPKEEKPRRVKDLMAALKASLEASDGDGAQAKPRRKARAKKKAA
jgi:DNA end-binding protein Ku